MKFIKFRLSAVTCTRGYLSAATGLTPSHLVLASGAFDVGRTRELLDGNRILSRNEYRGLCIFSRNRALRLEIDQRAQKRQRWVSNTVNSDLRFVVRR